ncbi:MAG TPA: class I tRNA ligase family protein, partial [Candidatus Saccharimonadales bacterium]|nr:class I tRNA ligase family protein [Candidatus Saccharimonadales bacterium]
PLGKKMSKSKGNVVNPLQVADQYGADAVRFALVYGTGLGNDQAMSYPKLEAARKFTNKLWNMARFIEMNRPEASSKYDVVSIEEAKAQANNETDKLWLIKIEDLADEITKYIDNYQFNLAAERLYEFTWHEFADKHIEDVKNRIDETSYVLLTTCYVLLLKLLHPFMPFVTEEIYSLLTKSEKPLMIEAWPKVKKR